MVDDFNAVAFALTERELPPGPETPTIRTTPSGEQTRKLTLHNEDTIARLSGFLHQLCSGMLGFFLRLRLVVTRLSKSWREGGTTSVGAVGPLSDAKGGPSSTMRKYGPAL